MIYIVYGTRAELIKFSSFIHELQKRKIKFRLIDTGDHDTKNIRKELGLPKPNYYFGKSLREKWSKIFYPQAVFLTALWGFYVFLRLFWIFLHDCFPNDTIIYHGNTKIVPLTVYAAKLVFFKNKKLVHFESGLRGNTRESFAFDTYSKIGDKNADILFVQSKTCEKNLKKEKMKGKIVFVGSPLIEVVKKTVSIKSRKMKNYVVINLVRSLTTRKRMEEFKYILKNSPFKIILILSQRMLYNLRKLSFKNIFRISNVKTFKEQNYRTFLTLIRDANAVITDSEGVQEECSILNVPCIITNDFLQLPELQKNGKVILTGWDSNKILKILDDIKNKRGFYQTVRKSKFQLGDGKATERIVDYLVSLK